MKIVTKTTNNLENETNQLILLFYIGIKLLLYAYIKQIVQMFKKTACVCKQKINL